MKSIKHPHKNNKGFTLLEVMLVIVLIGVMASAIQFNMGKSKYEEQLETASKRFAGLFFLASEYDLLNNIEMAIHIKDNTYQIMGFDGERWTQIDDKLFANTDLPEDIEISLELEDLPLEEPQLFDSNDLIPDEDDLFESDGLFNEGEDENGEEKKKKRIIPQIYILSGGDFTPFSLTFSVNELANFEEDITFKVTVLYDPRPTIEGPLYNEE